MKITLMTNDITSLCVPVFARFQQITKKVWIGSGAGPKPIMFNKLETLQLEPTLIIVNCDLSIPFEACEKSIITKRNYNTFLMARQFMHVAWIEPLERRTLDLAIANLEGLKK